MEKYLISVVLIIFCLNFVNTTKILIAHSSPSRSHVITVQALAKALVERGHDVTYITSFPLNKKLENYREIKIEFDEDAMDFVKDSIKKPGAFSGSSSMFKIPKILSKIGNDTLQSQDVQKLMKDENFDLVIVGYFFSEYFLGLGDHFKCPTILISPHGMMSPLALIMGNPLGVPASPHIALLLGNDFFSRLGTLLMYGFDIMLGKLLFESTVKNVYE